MTQQKPSDMRGLIFDIKEFALNDGAGVRSTVFFKGCPLRCVWCHNPEGLRPEPELYLKKAGCLDCGLCKKRCDHEDCRPYGRCLHICPMNLVTVAGQWISADALAAKLLKKRRAFSALSGGVTFSGGEPLLQWEFCLEVINRIRLSVNVALETSGYSSEEAFRAVVGACDFVYMDLKLIDDSEHKKYTGVSNVRILENAEWLKKSGVKHLFRTPLIPGITDTEENFRALAEFLDGEPVEFLPYNTLAPAKYESVNREFTDRIKEEKNALPNLSDFGEESKIR